MIALALTQIINTSKKYVLAGSSALIAAAAVFTLGSCSSDDEIVQTNYPADNIVRIDAGVNNMTTRASVETKDLTTFGFAIKNAASAGYSYNNIQVTKTGDTWTPASQMLWQNATQAVDVIAYAPYNEAFTGDLATTSDFDVSVEQEQKVDTYESDFLVCKKKDFVPGTGVDNKGAVPVAFNHALSQLEIKVVFGTELDNPEPLTENAVQTIGVVGTFVKGKCDFTQDTPVVTAIEDDNETPVIPYEVPGSFEAATKTSAGEVTNASIKYSCILIPQTKAAGQFGVILVLKNDANKAYTWLSPAEVKLEGGNKYTLTLTVGKDYVVAGEMKATPWVDADTSDYQQNIETD